MKSTITHALTLTLITVGVLSATIYYVPTTQYPYIQWAINAASNGDEIWVWGWPNQTPPYVYQENIDFGGKVINVINQSFTSTWPAPGHTCDSSWDSVVIQGQGNSQNPMSTVTITSPLTDSAVLHGFTVTGGWTSINGGGVNCVGGNPGKIKILSNRVTGNHADNMGGGICLDVTGEDANFEISHNLVTSNDASGAIAYGGGICASVEASASVSSSILDNNQIIGNSAGGKGGGVCLYRWSASSGLTGEVAGNVINQNTAPDYYGQGGGIYSYQWSCPARRNVISENSPEGVFSTTQYNSGFVIDLGASISDPGLNAFKGNRDYDLVVYNPNVMELQQPAVGNFWNSLDHSTIMGRIHRYGNDIVNLFYSPIAASGRYFNVAGTQTCQDNVLVTGDVQVSQESDLEIDPGVTLKFYPNPDDTISGSGCDPSKCDLIVAAQDGNTSGGILDATGTSTDHIHFRPAVTGMPSWDGIRVESGGNAVLDYCEIDSAYIAVSAYPNASLTVEHSKIHNNEVDGIWTSYAKAYINSDSILSNEVYGIVCNDLQDGSQISSNKVLGDLSYGISCNSYSQRNGELDITGNMIDAGLPSRTGQYGLDLSDLNSNVYVARNLITHYQQGGVGCRLYAFPVLRWNTIDNNGAGVVCDATSLPELGTDQNNAGNNSILMSNSYWIVNQSLNTLLAEGNWWGTAHPDSFPLMFVGPVDYSNWLLAPPFDQGGGQSASTSDVGHTLFLGCYPNPCSRSSVVRYQLAGQSRVSLKLYELSGKLVKTLASETQNPGHHNVTLDFASLGHGGSALAHGVYLLKFVSGNTATTQKLIVE